MMVGTCLSSQIVPNRALRTNSRSIFIRPVLRRLSFSKHLDRDVKDEKYSNQDDIEYDFLCFFNSRSNYFKK